MVMLLLTTTIVTTTSPHPLQSQPPLLLTTATNGICISNLSFLTNPKEWKQYDNVGTCSVIMNSNSFTDASYADILTIVNDQWILLHTLY
jgi:hypothetical protein